MYQRSLSSRLLMTVFRVGSMGSAQGKLAKLKGKTGLAPSATQPPVLSVLITGLCTVAAGS